MLSQQRVESTNSHPEQQVSGLRESCWATWRQNLSQPRVCMCPRLLAVAEAAVYAQVMFPACPGWLLSWNIDE